MEGGSIMVIYWGIYKTIPQIQELCFW